MMMLAKAPNIDLIGVTTVIGNTWVPEGIAYGIRQLEAINRTDILYMTRIQRERFSDLREYEQVKNVYCLHKAMLDHAKPNLRVLHPLPRVNEIAYDVDESEKAYYFQQAQNGLYTREAIICRMLNIQL